MNTLALAIIGHLVGDYLLQTDWQAAGKKKSSWICAVHCLLWTAAVVLLAGRAWWVWWVPLVLFTTHFIQDRTNLVRWSMQHCGQQQFAKPPMASWSVIAVDNTFPLLTLASVAKVLDGKAF